MKLLVNPKDKGGNQEKSPAKKKLSEFARTLKKVDVGAALRTMRAAFALAVDRSTLACVASGAAACVLASLLIERCDFARRHRHHRRPERCRRVRHTVFAACRALCFV